MKKKPETRILVELDGNYNEIFLPERVLFKFLGIKFWTPVYGPAYYYSHTEARERINTYLTNLEKDTIYPKIIKYPEDQE